MSESAGPQVAAALGRKLPPSFPLDFYAVVGTLKGLFIVLGRSGDEAEAEAFATLERCRPRRARRGAR